MTDPLHIPQAGPSSTPKPKLITSLAFSLHFDAPTPPKKPRLTTPSHSTPLRASTPLRTAARASTPLSTPARELKPLSARLGIDSPFGAAGFSRVPRPTRPLSDVVLGLETEEKPDVRVMRALGEVGAVGEIEVVERVKEEEEGVGVSPRKGKVAKWSGKGCVDFDIVCAELQTTNRSRVRTAADLSDRRRPLRSSRR